MSFEIVNSTDFISVKCKLLMEGFIKVWQYLLTNLVTYLQTYGQSDLWSSSAI